MRKILTASFLTLAAVFALQTTVQAAVRTTAAAGLWTNESIWVDSILPQAGDDVEIDHAVTLDQSTPALGSFVNNAEFTFEGWDTVITATTFTVNATITHPAQSDTSATNDVNDSWTPDNRVWIVCSNLTVNSAKEINVTGKGYAGGVGGSSDGKGPGGGIAAAKGSGAGHGGLGGTSSSGATGGSTYGNQTDPTDPGSGGGAGGRDLNRDGGSGGGVVLIDASGLVTVNGSILANGTNAGSAAEVGGGGSGGSIHILCAAFYGNNGTVSASGGTGGYYFPDEPGGDGAGGRIAISYTPADQAEQNMLAAPVVTIRSAGGFYDSDACRGEPGTVYVSDTSFYPGTTLAGVRLPSGIPSFSLWEPDTLTIEDEWVMIDAGLKVSVTNDVYISGSGGRLNIGDGTQLAEFSCNGDLILTNAARMHILSGPTNGVLSHGALLQVEDELVVPENGYLVLHSNPTNGGSALIKSRSLDLAETGTISATGLGFSGGTVDHLAGYGPGGGGYNSPYGGGGGYGGKGGNANSGAQGGATYGSSNLVSLCGSGGAHGKEIEPDRLGGAGGGLIRIETTGDMRIDGTIIANGLEGVVTGGSGSGGGIHLHCRNFMGTGALQANGADIVDSLVGTGAGGGGRIAVWRTVDAWTGTAIAAGGSGDNVAYDGEDGTVVWVLVPPSGTLMLIQ